MKQSMNELRKSLNLGQLIFFGIGTMIGAGIYSVIGAAAAEAGSHLWISFICAGFAAFLTVLSYAELSSSLPKAGAEYQFIKTAIPEWKWLSFMAGYLIAINAAATSATVSLAFAGYMNVFVEVPILLTAFLLLAACTCINIMGIRQSTWVSISLICVEVAGLLLLIWLGFVKGDVSRSFERSLSWDNAGGIFAATALIFFVFIGFEDIANLSEEANEPRRDIPRALLVSVIFTSVIYIMVAIAVMALSTAEQLSASTSPLTQAASQAIPSAGKALAIAALFATASTALISLISISRLLFGMAQEGDMPSPLARILGKRKTPWIAALALFSAACLLLPLEEVKIVASISSFGVLLVFITVHIAMIVLRFRQPNLKRHYKVPFSIGALPVPPVLGIIIAAALLTQFEPIVYAVGIGILGFGVFVFLIQTISTKK